MNYSLNCWKYLILDALIPLNAEFADILTEIGLIFFMIPVKHIFIIHPPLYVINILYLKIIPKSTIFYIVVLFPAPLGPLYPIMCPLYTSMFFNIYKVL